MMKNHFYVKGCVIVLDTITHKSLLVKMICIDPL